MKISELLLEAGDDAVLASIRAAGAKKKKLKPAPVQPMTEEEEDTEEIERLRELSHEKTDK